MGKIRATVSSGKMEVGLALVTRCFLYVFSRGRSCNSCVLVNWKTRISWLACISRPHCIYPKLIKGPSKILLSEKKKKSKNLFFDLLLIK